MNCHYLSNIHTAPLTHHNGTMGEEPVEVEKTDEMIESILEDILEDVGIANEKQAHIKQAAVAFAKLQGYEDICSNGQKVEYDGVYRYTVTLCTKRHIIDVSVRADGYADGVMPEAYHIDA
jgi:hypothetical protein